MGGFILDRNEDVLGLDVPVNDALLVGVLDGLAELHEQVQALLDVELVPVAVLGDGHAGDVLHHEVRSAILGRSGVEDLGHTGVVHHGQRLSLGLEPGDDLPGVHAQFDDLEGHAATDRFRLLSQVDHAHPALAEAFENLVPADPLRQTMVARTVIRLPRDGFFRRIGRTVRRRPIEIAAVGVDRL